MTRLTTYLAGVACLVALAGVHASLSNTGPFSPLGANPTMKWQIDMTGYPNEYPLTPQTTPDGSAVAFSTGSCYPGRLIVVSSSDASPLVNKSFSGQPNQVAFVQMPNTSGVDAFFGTGCDQGKFVRFNLESHDEKTGSTPEVGPRSVGWIAQQPVILPAADGSQIAYVYGQNNIAKLSVTDMSLLKVAECAEIGCPGTTLQPVVVAPHAGPAGELRLFTGDGYTEVLAFDEDLKRIWRKLSPGMGSPVVCYANGIVVAVNGMQLSYFDKPSNLVYGYNATNGELVWNISLPAVTYGASPLCIPEMEQVVVYTRFGNVAALSIHDGAAVWNTTVPCGGHDAEINPVTNGKTVFVYGANAVHALRADEGTLLWSSEGVGSHTSGISEGMSVSGATLFVSTDSAVTAFDLPASML